MEEKSSIFPNKEAVCHRTEPVRKRPFDWMPVGTLPNGLGSVKRTSINRHFLPEENSYDEQHLKQYDDL